MAMASFSGQVILVQKCNNQNSGTIHYPSVSIPYYYKSNNNSGRRIRVTKVGDSKNMASSVEVEQAEEKLGIKIQRNPPESKLSQLGVRNWPTWGCPPSKFPWTYSSKETCYLLKGKVKVYPDGSDEAVEFGAGDLVEFPNGMSCTWDGSETVDKHYKFE